MAQQQIIEIIPDDLVGDVADVKPLVKEFLEVCEPLERDRVYLLVDARTNARYCECHMRAAKIIALSTIDVPLDPDEQPDYRANRELVEDHVAFKTMKQDAQKRRTFSNIVAEFTRSYEPDRPIKIIGGQHRYTAIEEALKSGIDEYHGIKVYFGLNTDQRFDVQLISNTNIAASSDLFDRMQETQAGPELRKWCQDVGLLDEDSDFADRRQRGNQMTVKAARTFIINYFRGAAVNPQEFEFTDTTPSICKSGVPDPDWEELKRTQPKLWNDAGLIAAGKEFALLIDAQRAAHSEKGNIDYAEKAMNFAVIAAWAYVAGLLAKAKNETRLKRHYALRHQASRDPLNAPALAGGRHKTDPSTYRGLGYRTDAKERGRFVELFYFQAEKGNGIDKAAIDFAIKSYHAKRAVLEAREAKEKAS